MGGQIEGSDEVLLGVRFGPFGVRSGHLGGQIWSFGVDLRISDVRSQDLGVDLAISGSRGQISGSQMSPFGVVLGPKRGRFWTLFSSKQCFSIKRQNSVFAVFG